MSKDAVTFKLEAVGDLGIAVANLQAALSRPVYLSAAMLGAVLRDRIGIGCSARIDRPRSLFGGEHVLILYRPGPGTGPDDVHRVLRWRYGRYRREDIPRLVWTIAYSYARRFNRELLPSPTLDPLGFAGFGQPHSPHRSQFRRDMGIAVSRGAPA